jgi:hypothetical protein
MSQQFIDTLFSLKFIEVFFTALGVQLMTTLFKYVTKLRVLGVSAVCDRKEKIAAHFDCLRIGVDLSILGIVSFLAVAQLALSKVPKDNKDNLDMLQSMQTNCGIAEVVLALIAVILTTVYDSPERSFKRGTILPGMVGWLALFLSASFFHFLKLKG